MVEYPPTPPHKHPIVQDKKLIFVYRKKTYKQIKMSITEICIPKMDAEVTEKTIKEGIEKQKIGRIKKYTER